MGTSEESVSSIILDSDGLVGFDTFPAGDVSFWAGQSFEIQFIDFSITSDTYYSEFIVGECNWLLEWNPSFIVPDITREVIREMEPNFGFSSMPVTAMYDFSSPATFCGGNIQTELTIIGDLNIDTELAGLNSMQPVAESSVVNIDMKLLNDSLLGSQWQIVLDGTLLIGREEVKASMELKFETKSLFTEEYLDLVITPNADPDPLVKQVEQMKEDLVVQQSLIMHSHNFITRYNFKKEVVPIPPEWCAYTEGTSYCDVTSDYVYEIDDEYPLELVASQ